MKITANKPAVGSEYKGLRLKANENKSLTRLLERCLIVTFLIEEEYPAAGLTTLSYLFHKDAASAGAVERGHAVQCV